MSFCGLTNGISPKICILCVRVIINKCSFEPFCVWILTKDEFVCVGMYKKKFLDISICVQWNSYFKTTLKTKQKRWSLMRCSYPEK